MTFDAFLEAARVAIGVLLVIANIAVWYGVWLERDSAPPEVQHRGWRILIRGLAAETALGTLLLSVDTSIAIRQKAQLSQASSAAANAVLEAGNLGAKVDQLPAFVQKKEREMNESLSDFRRFAGETEAETNSALKTIQSDERSLREQVAQARSTLASSKTVAAQLESELRQQKHLREAIDKALAPRRLSESQIAQIGSALKQFADQKWVVTAYWEMKESLDLANQILDALTRAHWDYLRPTNGSFLLGGVTGVLIYSHPAAAPKTRAAAKALAEALTAAEIDCTLRDKSPKDPVDEIIALNVGSKR